MTTLGEARADVADVLDGLSVDLGGEEPLTLKAFDYMSENVEPPVYAVVPGQPYVQTSGDRLGFGCKRVTWAVVVLLTREASKSVAAAVDLLILAAMDALEEADYDVISASQPGQVTFPVSGLKFFGSVITIQHDLKL